MKLITAIGAWVGPAAVFQATLHTAVAGVVAAAGLVIARGCVWQTYGNIQAARSLARRGFAPHSELTLDTSTSPRLTYAIPILVGTVTATWLH